MTVFFCYSVISWNWAGICKVLSQNKLLIHKHKTFLSQYIEQTDESKDWCQSQ